MNTFSTLHTDEKTEFRVVDSVSELGCPSVSVLGQSNRVTLFFDSVDRAREMIEAIERAVESVT
jgi:hypothetical protein